MVPCPFQSAHSNYRVQCYQKEVGPDLIQHQVKVHVSELVEWLTFNHHSHCQHCDAGNGLCF